jgi:tetratricopeptide (TPR) repeat protein
VEDGLRLAPALAELHAVRARIQLLGRRATGAANASAKLALANGGNASGACAAAAELALATGDLAAAQRFAQRGIDGADAAPALRTLLARILAAQGRRHHAIQTLQHVLAAAPSYGDARFELARVLAGARQFDAAHEELEHLLAAEPRASYAALFAYVAACRGDALPARELLGGTRPALLIGYLGHYFRAYAHLGLGDVTHAMEQLRLSARAGEPPAAFVQHDEIFAQLRTQSAFPALGAA